MCVACVKNSPDVQQIRTAVCRSRREEVRGRSSSLLSGQAQRALFARTYIRRQRVHARNVTVSACAIVPSISRGATDKNLDRIPLSIRDYSGGKCPNRRERDKEVLSAYVPGKKAEIDVSR